MCIIDSFLIFLVSLWATIEQAPFANRPLERPGKRLHGPVEFHNGKLWDSVGLAASFYLMTPVCLLICFVWHCRRTRPIVANWTGYKKTFSNNRMPSKKVKQSNQTIHSIRSRQEPRRPNRVMRIRLRHLCDSPNNNVNNRQEIMPIERNEMLIFHFLHSLAAWSAMQSTWNQTKE